LLWPSVAGILGRDDGALPTVVAVATLPIISADGVMIYTDRLDRGHGIVFNVEPALMKIIPNREDCDKTAVGTAMQFLTDDWLADVAPPTTPASAVSSPWRSRPAS
jgi:hypothetical protein